MYKLVFIPAFLFFFNSYSTAQKTKISDIIANVKSDVELLNNIKTTEYLSGLNYNLPWIKEVELRLGINGNVTADKLDGYLRNEDFYSLRVAPNSLRERRYQQALKPAQIDLYRSNNNVILQEVIFERYLSVMTIYYSQKNIEGKTLLKPLFDNKSVILAQMLEQGSDIKFKDVVEAEYDKNDLLNDLDEFQNNIRDESNKITQLLGLKDSVKIDFSHFITPELIELRLNRTDLSVLNNPEIVNQQEKIEYAEAEYNFQHARNKQILTFFQFGYSPQVVDEAPKTKFNPSNDMTFRFGVNVPIKSNNNLKRSESALKVYEEQQEVETLKSQLSTKIELKKTKILQLIASRKEWKRQHDESLIPKLLKNESIKAQITPLELVDLQIDEIKLQLHQHKLDEKIVLEYLEFLQLSGAILDLDVNYLEGV